MARFSKADLCLITTSGYPYGGSEEAQWLHVLLQEQQHLSIHLVTLLPRSDHPLALWKLPRNVMSLQAVPLLGLPPGAPLAGGLARRMHEALQPPLAALLAGEQFSLSHLGSMLRVLGSARAPLGAAALIEDDAAWDAMTSLYDTFYPNFAFLPFLQAYRALMQALFTVLLAPLPPATCYHALSPGLAGVMAARGKIAASRPVVLTLPENGLLPRADGLQPDPAAPRELGALWRTVRRNIARLGLEAADTLVAPMFDDDIVSLSAIRQMTMPGVDVKRFAALARRARHTQPRIGMLGRLTPEDDAKTFLRAVALLRPQAPDLVAYVPGSPDDDPRYAQECHALCAMLGLEHTVTFTGELRVEEYLPRLDVAVATRIAGDSSRQLLEAGAAGIPLVATDIGIARLLIDGAADEQPALGVGGILTPLTSPVAMAQAATALLSDYSRYAAASQAIAARVATTYDARTHHHAYRRLYGGLLGLSHPATEAI